MEFFFSLNSLHIIAMGSAIDVRKMLAQLKSRKVVEQRFP
jgi:hypothetical protein